MHGLPGRGRNVESRKKKGPDMGGIAGTAGRKAGKAPAVCLIVFVQSEVVQTSALW